MQQDKPTWSKSIGRRAMAIWMPNWSTDLLLRADRARTDGRKPHEHSRSPLLLISDEHQRKVVKQCCEYAYKAGIRPGMPLAQARALFDVDSVRIERYDPRRDLRALGKLAVWAQRLSPVVAVDDSHAEGEPDGLLLDVTGCERVWGGENRLVRNTISKLQRFGFRARVSIAPTFGCAWSIARFGNDPMRLVEPGGVRSAIAPLHVSSMRITHEAVVKLAEVGIKQVGELLELPRSTLPARFGHEILLRLDQALGTAIETIEPVRPLPPPSAERAFDGPTNRTEVIELTVRELLNAVGEQLEHRGCGARRVEIELSRSDLEPECFSVVLGRPSKDPVHLWKLVRSKLERAHLGFGVEAVHVRIPAVGRLRYEQSEYVGSTTEAPPEEIARSCAELLDTLGNRLGAQHVLRAELRESHMPERAFTFQSMADTENTSGACIPHDRPTVLFDRPQPAEVIALTPDGPVHRVKWDGDEHGVTDCFGPERIGDEWWRAHPSKGSRTRDYFTVRDEQGRWIWLGRGIESGRWFVHGIWA